MKKKRKEKKIRPTRRPRKGKKLFEELSEKSLGIKAKRAGGGEVRCSNGSDVHTYVPGARKGKFHKSSFPL